MAPTFLPRTPLTNANAVKLSWSRPAIGTPYGYFVRFFGPTTTPIGTVEYVSMATLGTAETTITVPPGLLAPGNTYILVITAVADGRANMETSPNRSALPTANADVMSAPQTISSATP